MALTLPGWSISLSSAPMQRPFLVRSPPTPSDGFATDDITRGAVFLNIGYTRAAVLLWGGLLLKLLVQIIAHLANPSTPLWFLH